MENALYKFTNNNNNNYNYYYYYYYYYYYLEAWCVLKKMRIKYNEPLVGNISFNILPNER